MFLSLSLDVKEIGATGESRVSFEQRAREVEELKPEFVFLARESQENLLAPPRIEALVNLAWISGILETPILVAGLPGQHSLPYHVARALSASDFLTEGRVGWAPLLPLSELFEESHNILNGTDDFDEVARLDDFVSATKALWDSWDEDALLIEKETGKYLDSNKVRRVDYQGPFFKTMGSLNAARPPQGHPLLVIDVDSTKGRNQHADVVVGSAPEILKNCDEPCCRLLKVNNIEEAKRAIDANDFDGVYCAGDDAVEILRALREGLPPNLSPFKKGRDRLGLSTPENLYSGKEQ